MACTALSFILVVYSLQQLVTVQITIPQAALMKCFVCACAGAAPCLQCGMARLPNNPSLLVMYASFLIEARKDGQASRTQLQLAQKASPSLLDNYTIYVTQQLAKQLKRGKPTQHKSPGSCLHWRLFARTWLSPI